MGEAEAGARKEEGDEGEKEEEGEEGEEEEWFRTAAYCVRRRRGWPAAHAWL